MSCTVLAQRNECEEVVFWMENSVATFKDRECFHYFSDIWISSVWKSIISLMWIARRRAKKKVKWPAKWHWKCENRFGLTYSTALRLFCVHEKKVEKKSYLYFTTLSLSSCTWVEICSLAVREKGKKKNVEIESFTLYCIRLWSKEIAQKTLT